VSELKKLTADHPQFANFDGSDSVADDGQSVGVASGTATPQTTGTPGQPKLKLTFNNPNAESATSAATSTVNGADADED
jgi:ATP-dependent helicase STH1/SNF2